MIMTIELIIQKISEPGSWKNKYSQISYVSQRINQDINQKISKHHI